MKKKCKIIERAVAETHYTSWALNLIGLIISLTVGAYLSALAASNSIAAGVLVALFLIVLGIYARFRLCFERNRAMLLCALNHLKTMRS